jgi:magnesium chelatase family protein
VSGPILDRFDLRLTIGRPNEVELLGAGAGPGEPSSKVRERVALARRIAELRGVAANAALCGGALDRCAPLTPDATRMLEHRLRLGSLSARGLDRVRRVARTIADLELVAKLVSEGSAGRSLDGFDAERFATPLELRHVSSALELRAEVLRNEAA